MNGLYRTLFISPTPSLGFCHAQEQLGRRKLGVHASVFSPHFKLPQHVPFATMSSSCPGTTLQSVISQLRGHLPCTTLAVTSGSNSEVLLIRTGKGLCCESLQEAEASQLRQNSSAVRAEGLREQVHTDICLTNGALEDTDFAQKTSGDEIQRVNKLNSKMIFTSKAISFHLRALKYCPQYIPESLKKKNS